MEKIFNISTSFERHNGSHEEFSHLERREGRQHCNLTSVLEGGMGREGQGVGGWIDKRQEAR
jgi:hypothetical protein